MAGAVRELGLWGRPDNLCTQPHRTPTVARLATRQLGRTRSATRTDLLYLAPRELLGDLPGLLGLELRPAPIPLPAIEVAMFWHPRSSQDSGHIWLREQLDALLRERLGQAQQRN